MGKLGGIVSEGFSPTCNSFILLNVWSKSRVSIASDRFFAVSPHQQIATILPGDRVCMKYAKGRHKEGGPSKQWYGQQRNMVSLYYQTEVKKRVNMVEACPSVEGALLDERKKENRPIWPSVEQ